MQGRLNVLTVIAKSVLLAVIVLTGATIVHNVTLALSAAARAGHLPVYIAALH